MGVETLDVARSGDLKAGIWLPGRLAEHGGRHYDPSAGAVVSGIGVAAGADTRDLVGGDSPDGSGSRPLVERGG